MSLLLIFWDFWGTMTDTDKLLGLGIQQSSSLVAWYF